MLSIVTNKFIRKTKIKSVKLALSNNTRTEKKTKGIWIPTASHPNYASVRAVPGFRSSIMKLWLPYAIKKSN